MSLASYQTSTDLSTDSLAQTKGRLGSALSCSRTYRFGQVTRAS